MSEGQHVKDSIYADKQGQVQGFCFDDKVTRVFADMIQRSVPGYGLTLQMIAVIAAQYAQKNTRLYDLGCSLGAATLAMRHGIQQVGCEIVAVDNSEAMLEQCAAYIASDTADVPVVLTHADIQDVVIENASVVVLNFTLQFIPVNERETFLKHVFKGLRAGGVLILSEKIAFDDAQKSEHQRQLHEGFKRSQGYSELEVSQKRQALENILIPESLQAHHQRLNNAGFTHSETWFQCFNFASMLAFK